MRLLVGLGNPGTRYLKTRHNAGFLALDELLIRARGTWQGRKFDGEVAKCELYGVDVFFLKPLTFMNLSGQSVGQALQFFKKRVDEVIVVHDDIDLPFGEVKTRIGGGHGGHNGIRSLVERLGSGDFARIKIGVGRPQGAGPDIASWVLSDFSTDELIRLQNDSIQEIESRLVTLLKN